MGRADGEMWNKLMTLLGAGVAQNGQGPLSKVSVSGSKVADTIYRDTANQKLVIAKTGNSDTNTSSSDNWADCNILANYLKSYETVLGEGGTLTPELFAHMKTGLSCYTLNGSAGTTTIKFFSSEAMRVYSLVMVEIRITNRPLYDRMKAYIDSTMGGDYSQFPYNRIPFYEWTFAYMAMVGLPTGMVTCMFGDQQTSSPYPEGWQVPTVGTMRYGGYITGWGSDYRVYRRNPLVSNPFNFLSLNWGSISLDYTKRLHIELYPFDPTPGSLYDENAYINNVQFPSTIWAGVGVRGVELDDEELEINIWKFPTITIDDMAPEGFGSWTSQVEL